MTTAVSIAKSELRATIEAKLKQISPLVRMAESLDLCALLKPQLQSARSILFFAPRVDELDIWPLLEQSLEIGKNCALPVFDPITKCYSSRKVEDLEADIRIGHFKVREPAADCKPMPLNCFDLILVPGLLFDIRGNRLGRGKGYYDRLLAECSGVKCGIAFDFQVLETIPTEPHDQQVNFIFTPSRSIRRKS